MIDTLEQYGDGATLVWPAHSRDPCRLRRRYRGCQREPEAARNEGVIRGCHRKESVSGEFQENTRKRKCHCEVWKERVRERVSLEGGWEKERE